MGLKMSRLKPSQGAGEDGSKWTKQLCKVTNMWTYIRNEWRMTDWCPARSISNTTLVLWERETQDLRMSKWQEIRSCRPLVHASFTQHTHRDPANYAEGVASGGAGTRKDGLFYTQYNKNGYSEKNSLIRNKTRISTFITSILHSTGCSTWELAKKILSNPSWKESCWIISTHKRCDLVCSKT